VVFFKRGPLPPVFWDRNILKRQAPREGFFCDLITLTIIKVQFLPGLSLWLSVKQTAPQNVWPQINSVINSSITELIETARSADICCGASAAPVRRQRGASAAPARRQLRKFENITLVARRSVRVRIFLAISFVAELSPKRGDFVHSLLDNWCRHSVEPRALSRASVVSL